MFARRLLVSPDLVARPGRRALRTPADGYTERDIYRIARLEGSHPARAAGVWLSRPPALITPVTSPAGRGIQPGSTVQSRDAGTGAG